MSKDSATTTQQPGFIMRKNSMIPYALNPANFDELHHHQDEEKQEVAQTRIISMGDAAEDAVRAVLNFFPDAMVTSTGTQSVRLWFPATGYGGEGGAVVEDDGKKGTRPNRKRKVPAKVSKRLAKKSRKAKAPAAKPKPAKKASRAKKPAKKAIRAKKPAKKASRAKKPAKKKTPKARRSAAPAKD